MGAIGSATQVLPTISMCLITLLHLYHGLHVARQAVVTYVVFKSVQLELAGGLLLVIGC